MAEIRADLLELGAEILEELPAKLGPECIFKLSLWSCGFSACAIGHMAMDARFQALGLTLEKAIGGLQPVYKTYRGWMAVQKLFGITYQTAVYLFMDISYPPEQRDNPLAVAARIRELIGRPKPAKTFVPEVPEVPIPIEYREQQAVNASEVSKV